MTDARKCTAFKANGDQCQGGRKGDTEWCGTHQTKESRAKGIAGRLAKEQAAAAAELEAELLELLGEPAEVRAAEHRGDILKRKRAGLLGNAADELAKSEAIYRFWMGPAYDMDAFRAAIACVAVERFNDGSDPCWLLIVGGSGNAKTETLVPAEGAKAIVTSDITGPAALLSGTPEKERSKDATGGLLRELGPRGTLVIKDFTTILSMSRDKRAEVLAALREIFDGHWSRRLGADGGGSLEWEGRIVIVGAVTSLWDEAHEVIAACGDRFVCLRPNSTTAAARLAIGMSALSNLGSERRMRSELKAAFGAAVDAADVADPYEPTDDERSRLLQVANLVTAARTAVVRDPNGEVAYAHDSEAPTRFAKQLLQVMRGAVAVGMSRQEALRLAVRCGRDSMPPRRLKIIDHLSAWALTYDGQEQRVQRTTEIRRAVGLTPRTTDRELQALFQLSILEMHEIAPSGLNSVEEGEEVAAQIGAVPKARWAYRLADGIDAKVLITI